MSIPEDVSPTVKHLEHLYSDHHDWLQGWLRRRLGSAADAADLAHDAFLRLLTTPRHFGSAPEARTYLRTMANGLCIDLACIGHAFHHPAGSDRNLRGRVRRSCRSTHRCYRYHRHSPGRPVLPTPPWQIAELPTRLAKRGRAVCSSPGIFRLPKSCRNCAATIMAIWALRPKWPICPSSAVIRPMILIVHWPCSNP